MWYMNAEREMLVNAFKEFAEQEIRPMVSRMEEDEEYPREAIRKLGELGMLGLALDEEYGGAGADYINHALMLEEFAKVSHGFTLLAYLASTLTINVVHKMCTPEQVEKFIKPATRGEILFSIAATEPNGAYNTPEYSTVGVVDGDEIILNGSKILITNSDVADVHIVVCRTGEVNPVTNEGISLVFVPSSTPGFSVGHMEHKLGWKGSHTGQIYFDNCRIPKSYVIGEFNNVWPVFFPAMAPEFAAYGPMNLGAMEAIWEKTADFLKNRIQYGQSIWDSHESVRYEMARLWAKINCYRGSVYSAMADRNNGTFQIPTAISLKVEGEELLREVASNCIEFHGGMGTIYETGIERFYRDAKMGGVGCGSNKTFVNSIASMI